MRHKISKKIQSFESNVCIIGLGYVGLPLAVEFGKHFNTIGYDLNETRVLELRNHHDRTNELNKEEIKESKLLNFSTKKDDIRNCNIFVITVPTPINKNKEPDLSMIESASRLVGSILKKNDIVIYESTVYPGTTDEVCLPLLEELSSLKINKDFYLGYSPERINPGDKVHNLVNIKKIVSGSNQDAAGLIEDLYKTIIRAGVVKTSSIKVAEAAKVIENTQRDINIALINELSIIFDKLNISTNEVLDAAETKWNFIPFRPGLVGGHCIGVDPYYLTYKAKSVGINPEVILAGRKINDEMSIYIVQRLIKEMKKNNIKTDQSSVLIMGFAFKENCPDHRNTKVADVYKNLVKNGCSVDCYDPLVDIDSVRDEYDIKLINSIKKNTYDAIIIAVAHDEFKRLPLKSFIGYMKDTPIIYDVKNLITEQSTDLTVL